MKALRLVMLWALTIFSSQLWGYPSTTELTYRYDAVDSYVISLNTQSETQNHSYDESSNVSYCCSEASSSDSREKTQDGSFFSFDIGLVATKGPAQRLADKVQGLPSSQRPNTVAVIKHKDGTITVGRNQGGVQNSTVQNALDKVPSNCFAGQCAEIKKSDKKAQ